MEKEDYSFENLTPDQKRWAEEYCNKQGIY